MMGYKMTIGDIKDREVILPLFRRLRQVRPRPPQRGYGGKIEAAHLKYQTPLNLRPSLELQEKARAKFQLHFQRLVKSGMRTSEAAVVTLHALRQPEEPFVSPPPPKETFCPLPRV